MKKYIFAICLLSLGMIGCADKAKEAYVKGCEDGISEAVTAWGGNPDKVAIEAFCMKSQAAQK